MSDRGKRVMNPREQLAYWLYDRGYLRFLPWRLVKHWLWPLSVRGRKVGFDARTYFDSWYLSVGTGALSDRLTISPRTTEAQARFHYNVAENSIIRYFSRRGFPVQPRVLDVGSGAGHWIDFYLQVFGAEHVVGVDLVPACVDALRTRYSNDSRVTILEGDISTPEFVAGQEFDVVNAIGVMFHIVDDDAWRYALANISRQLKVGGRLVAGGQFGWRTGDIQFHGRDEFRSLDEMREPAAAREVRVNKRIRSRGKWRREAGRNRLRLAGVVRSESEGSIVTPENNIAVFEKI